MEEKRKYERFNIDVPVRVEVMSPEGDSETLKLETMNVSAEGAFLKPERPLREGTQVRVEIELSFEELKSASDPDGVLIIAATGLVVRSGREGTAIHFCEDYDIKPYLDFIQKKT